EEGVAQVEAGFHAARVLGTVARDGGVSIEANPVAIATAQHLIHGDLVGLPGEIPEGHLHPADAPAFPPVATELFGPPEQALDVARVLAQETTLEHQGVARTASVPDLAVSRQALVCVDPDDRYLHRSSSNLGDPEIRDSKVRRSGAPIDVLRRVGNLVL